MSYNFYKIVKSKLLIEFWNFFLFDSKPNDFPNLLWLIFSCLSIQLGLI